MFRAPAQGCFAVPTATYFCPWRTEKFRVFGRDLLLATVPKVGKSTGKNQGSFTSLRAMDCGNLMLHATRSRKFSCIVPPKDCLSNSAAAAETNVEQHFWFYRCSA